jgi:acyl-CoA thioester hydrolase
MARGADPTGVEGRTATRVRYPETDRMGVAHHTHYLAWFELGRTELMRELGCTYAELEDRDGIYFPVVALDAAFRAPARYDEVVVITTRLVWIGGVRVKFEYTLSREGDDTVLATGSTEHATVDRRGRPRRLPPELRRQLQGMTERE